jgi:hypothetical protein
MVAMRHSEVRGHWNHWGDKGDKDMGVVTEGRSRSTSAGRWAASPQLRFRLKLRPPKMASQSYWLCSGDAVATRRQR